MGKAPQHPSYEDDPEEEVPALAPELEPLADEIAAALAAHEERQAALTEEEETRELADVTRDADLARRLLAAVEGRLEQLDAIEYSRDLVIDDWIVDIPFDLLECGERDAAVELAAALDARLSEARPSFRETHARILARAGRTDEARAMVELMLTTARTDDDLDTLYQVAELCALLQDDERAEQLTREILERGRELDIATKLAAQDTLVELLRKRGAVDEADGLAERFGAHEPIDDSNDDFPEFDEAQMIAAAEALIGKRSIVDTLVRAPAVSQPVVVAAKPGRNDPCSCGSGKKFKKCCG